MDLILYINTLYNYGEAFLLKEDHGIFSRDADQVERRRLNKREDNYLTEFLGSAAAGETYKELRRLERHSHAGGSLTCHLSEAGSRGTRSAGGPGASHGATLQTGAGA